MIIYSDAHRNLRNLIDRVNEDAKVITITTNNKNVTLFSEPDYNLTVLEKE